MTKDNTNQKFQDTKDLKLVKNTPKSKMLILLKKMTIIQRNYWEGVEFSPETPESRRFLTIKLAEEINHVVLECCTLRDM